MGRRKQSRTILFHSTTEDAAASILVFLAVGSRTLQETT